MYKITIVLGNRKSDKLTIALDDLTDAVEIYNKVAELTGSEELAQKAVQLVDSGNFILEDE